MTNRRPYPRKDRDVPDDTEITRQEMLGIRIHVRQKLLLKLHEHMLMARALRRAGKHVTAAAEQLEANTLKETIRHLDGIALDEPDLPSPPTRIIEVTD